VLVFVDALERADSLEPQAVREALRLAATAPDRYIIAAPRVSWSCSAATR
jgi:hypothetical protein